jgi:cell wall assembly regulator SMI1
VIDRAPPFLTEALLDELLARWRERNLPILATRRPGLSDGEIDELEREFDTVFSEELRCWWRWQDGAPRPTIVVDGRKLMRSTHPGPEFLSAARALSEATFMRSIDESNYFPTDPDPLRSWWPDWVPITTNISGGVLACDTGGRRDEPCRVRYVQYGVTEIPPLVTAESLGQIVTWWIELCDRGFYYYNDQHDKWFCDNTELEHFPGPEGYRSFYAGG